MIKILFSFISLATLIAPFHARADSCTSFSTSAVIKEIRDLVSTKYQEKRISYELKGSRVLIRDLTKAIKKQHIRVKRALLHELTTPNSLAAAYRELSKLEERLLLAKQAQLTKLRGLLSADERRKLALTIRKYY
jgi:hypothetical protein